MKMSDNKKFIIKAIVAGLGAGLFLFLLSSPRNIKNANFTRKTGTKELVSTRKSRLGIPELKASAVYVFDIKENELLYASNENKKMPLASLTKLMVATVVYDLDLPKDLGVEVTKEALSQEGDSKLLSGEFWKLKDLLDFALIESSNDATRAVALGIMPFIEKNNDEKKGIDLFIKAMNKKANEMGLSETYFLNDTGLDLSTEVSGGYGSARDVAAIINYLYFKHPEALELTNFSEKNFYSLNKIKHQAENTDTVLDKIPLVLASKTGYTELAGGNFAVIFDVGYNHPVTAVVLGSTEEGRFEDVEVIAKAVYDSFGR